MSQNGETRGVGFRISGMDTIQGTNEEESEPYSEYGEEPPEFVTKKGAIPGIRMQKGRSVSSSAHIWCNPFSVYASAPRVGTATETTDQSANIEQVATMIAIPS